jgi:hypothetical protein
VTARPAGLLLEARDGMAALALSGTLSLLALACLMGIRAGRVR